MNIVRALDVALPELPERVVRNIPPKLDPGVIHKEHLENGEPVIIAKKPGTEFVFRLSPLQWRLMQLFNGNRSYAEIAELFLHETGTRVSEDEIKELVSMLQAESSLLYRTPLEQNILLQQELRSSRKKRKKKVVDFSDITIKTWHNADHYITWLYPRLRFLFTPWFVWTSVAMFVVMGGMWADRFGEIWADSFAFYNFINKSGRDLLEFWVLFGAMAAIHETAHGLVGKHFGATIEKMGFTLMYFAPSFFCDATQVWVKAGKWARIATSIAGIWLDLVVCFFATVVWWGTATGMAVHDWAYKVMMVTGIGVSVLNLNPLIKLDGYMIFCELVGEPSLKETSTAYLSEWVRRNIFRLPVEVAYVPRRKRGFYIAYAVLSGLYSYSLLSFLMIITYHILRSFSPEWAFLPALAIGVWVFRSRIKLAVKFMKMLYLDKKEAVRAWFTPVRAAIVAAGLALLVFLPIWPDFVQGPFVLMASQRMLVHTTVPGTVWKVLAREGQQVAQGAPLAQLRNLDLQSQASRAQAELSAGTSQAVLASLQYRDFPAMEQERRRLAETQRLVSEELSQLTVLSPLTGTVVTPRPGDLDGRSLDEGDQLLEVADLSRMQARVYLPEFSMHDLRKDLSVRLLVHGEFAPRRATLSYISPSTVPIADGLVPKETLQGINPPRFYLGTAVLQNDQRDLKEGMTGTAKVLVGRRSLAGFAARFAGELVRRKVW
ncbi:MAG TPA: HlyD family efflux transporter periplasmic adaptor subunit [Terriglobales bacterium]|nr:HlyD family efflux transporter periplasmic adaptor subunit [Terriglobales bacterium]